MKETLYNIAKVCDLQVVGPNMDIYGFNLSNRNIEAPCVITYCTSPTYLGYATHNPKAGAIILSPDLYDMLAPEEKRKFSFIISPHPEWCFYELYMTLYEKNWFDTYSFDTITEHVIFGEGTIIEKGVTIGKNVRIGYNSVITSGTIIGDNVEIGSCTVIGGNGFQLIKDDRGVNHAIPHAGRTYIGNNVYIGNNTSICRSLFEGFTRIGDDTKISDQVYISHNCVIGKNCVLCGNNTLYGSCELKENVWLAPDASVMNRVVIGEGAFIGGSSLVARKVKAGRTMFGIPAERIR